MRIDPLRGFLLSAAFALLAAFLPARVAAAPAFTPDYSVIFSSLEVQAVLPSTAGFRMYLTSGSYQVYSATSSDQISWTLEPGVRLATTTDSLDASSITALGVYVSSNPADVLRMFYVGISSYGTYSVLSATSTDGLVWSKESGSRLQSNGGYGFLGSPSPISLGTSGMRLFYTADKNGANLPADYSLYSASSTDGGRSLTVEGNRLAVQAYQVSVATLSDGRTRLLYTAPLTGETTGSQVLSAISTDGTTFSAESGVRLSTASATARLTGCVVLRSTESFRWRMFSSYVQPGSPWPLVAGALTRIPVLESFTPNSVMKTQTNVSFTLAGEILTVKSTAQFAMGPSTITATNLSAVSDLQLTGIVDPFGQAQGRYDLTVTNPSGYQATSPWALTIELPPGVVTILDNLFRPLRGQAATISVEIAEAGNVTLDLYTVDGGHVATLYDGPMPQGTTSVSWAGKTAAGSYVASGVYLLSVQAPKLKTVERIVVIK